MFSIFFHREMGTGWETVILVTMRDIIPVTAVKEGHKQHFLRLLTRGIDGPKERISSLVRGPLLLVRVIQKTINCHIKHFLMMIIRILNNLLGVIF